MLIYYAPCLEPGSCVGETDRFPSLTWPSDHRIHGFLHHSIMRRESTRIPVAHTIVVRIVAINDA